jgi:ribosomal protection tetracycline resistance protein
MGWVEGAGTRSARTVAGLDRDVATDLLAGHDEDLLAAYVAGRLSERRLRRALARQTRRAMVHPVFFGSAVTGAGVDALTAGLTKLLPTAHRDADGEPAGQVFKIERGPTGEKVAYLRLFSGTLRTRSRLGSAGDKVTAIAVFDGGSWVRRPLLRAGEIGQVRGLVGARVGDVLGGAATTEGAQFAPPTLETVVVPRRPEHRGRLRAALAQLAEQDPLINVRQDDLRHELSVFLYGEVQKEVIQATLANDFGVDVTFRATTALCIERPRGRGEAVEVLNAEGNPFLATIGLRVEPAGAGSGVTFRLCVDPRTVPMFIYKSVDTFAGTMEQHVRAALSEGLSGWPVSDCTVTMFRCAYSSFDGPPSTRGPLSTAADYRRLTPMVLMRALANARSVVCEPTLRVSLEIPAGTLGAVLALLGPSVVTVHTGSSDLSTVEAVLPVSRVPDLQRRLPGLTSGEGVLETRFEAYAPVIGDAPTRPRTTVNPLHREEYLAHLRQGGS